MSKTATEPVNAKTIWDIAAEPTDVKSAPAQTLDAAKEWALPEPPKPAAATPAEEPKKEYSAAYYELSGKNTAGMVTSVTTMGYGGLNHYLMKRKIAKIMDEDTFMRLDTQMSIDPTKVSEEDKIKLKKIAKIIDLEDKMKGEIAWTEQEEKVLAECFTDYQKFTGKPLPPWIMIVFCIVKKTLKVTNAYIFS